MERNCVLEVCSVRGASKVNIFMQMFRIRARLRKLPRVLSVREIEEGQEEKTLWLLQHAKWIEGSVSQVGYLCVYSSPGINFLLCG